MDIPLHEINDTNVARHVMTERDRDRQISVIPVSTQGKTKSTMVFQCIKNSSDDVSIRLQLFISLFVKLKINTLYPYIHRFFQSFIASTAYS